MIDRILSPHFRLDSEYDQIIWSATTGIHIVPSPLQVELHRELAFTVETLYRIPCNVPTRVTSGQRNVEIVNALEIMGYPVSKLTDHYFMETVEIERGYRWNGSSGAWDLDFPGNEEQTYDYFRDAYLLCMDDENMLARIGQMIYYPEVNGRAVIHISNAMEIAFGASIVNLLRRLRPDRIKFLYKTEKGFAEYKGRVEV